MPNYRKKKNCNNNNNRNKNKNKNLNQSTNRSTTTTTSSSVKQETSEFTSVGISPNLPADVNISRTTTSSSSTTSASVLDTVKGVVIVDDSSPSSNEEIDENAERNVDTDTCSSDIKTVLTQSNYASSFYTSSSSKESTEIERKSTRTVSDGDSTFGNLAITDTFDAGSGKNSLKTGSTQSKDAAVSTAAQSATKSLETTRIIDKNGTGLEAVLDGSGSSQSSTSTSKVIIHKTFKKESKKSTTSSPKEEEDHYETVTPIEKLLKDSTSKVIVNKTFKRESTKSTSSGLPSTTSEADHYETVIVQETPEGSTSKVIVHQFAKGGAPNPTAVDTNSDANSQQKVIVHQVEESNATRHVAAKTDSNQSPIVIAQQITKKKATRSNTSSLQTSSEQIVHQISKEGQEKVKDQTTTSSNQSEERPSRVIVHQISKEDAQDHPTKQSDLPSKVIVHQISKDEETHKEQSSQVIVHPISQDHSEKPTSSTHQTEQQSSEVIVQKEDSQKSDSYSGVSGDFVPQKISKVILHQISVDTEKPNKNVEPPAQSNVGEDHLSKVIAQTNSADQSKQLSKVIVHQISKENSSLPTSVTEATKDPTPQNVSKVIVQQISKEGPDQAREQTSEDHRSRVISTQTSLTEGVTVHSSTKEAGAFPKVIPNHAIVHSTQTTSPPLYTQAGSRQHNPFEDALRKERMYQPSSPRPIPPDQSGRPLKVIVHPILQEQSTQTECGPLQCEDKVGPPPPARTAFPVSRSPKMIVHPIHRDPSEKQVFPFTPRSLEKLDRSSKVIAHQILKAVSSELQSSLRADRVKQNMPEVPPEAVRTSFPVSAKGPGPIRPGFFEASQIQSESNPIDSIEPRVILHQIGKEEPKLSENGPQQFPVLKSTNEPSVPGDLKSEVIVHKFLREESKSSASSTSSSTTSTIGDAEPKVIVHQISKEESALPFSTNNASQETPSSPSSSKDLESKVIIHQISHEESKLAKSTTSSTASEWDIPPKSKTQESGQTSPEESKLTQSTSSATSTTTTTTEGDKIRQSKASSSNSKRVDERQHLQGESQVIVDHISRVESKLTQSSTTSTTATKDDGPPQAIDEKIVPLPADLQTRVIDQQLSQDDSIASSSSEGSARTTISVKSQESPVTAVAEGQEKELIESSKEIVHKIHQEIATSPSRETTPPAAARVIIHPIVREIVSDKPLSYRVESPQPENRQLIVRKSKSFDDDDVVIQEMSDTSSAYDTDNPPVISEAESETDTLEAVDEFTDTEINSRILSVQTLPMDNEEDNTGPMSPKSTQEYKLRRQQNRAALQSHFLPQFLSPIFLDSIKEENSDHSDTDRRSECSDRTDHATQQGDLEDDVFHEGGPHAKKADAVFPKSNLDFSKKHKNIHTNVRPPKTSVIREEAPPPTVVEAKIIDQRSIEEGCSSWSTDLTPESEAAEVVYIDSASSSVSDLLELDYSQGQTDDSTDVRIQTPTIDLESVNEMFAYRQSESNEPSTPSPPQQKQQQQQPQPPVKEGENMRDQIVLPPSSLTSTATDRVHTTTTLSSETTTKSIQHKIPDEIILETMSATVEDNNDDDDVVAAADRARNSKENISNSCDNAINEVVTSTAAVGHIGKMENLREIVSASLESELNTITDLDTDRGVSKPISTNFKIGEPCSDYAFTSSTTSSTSSSSTSTTTTTTTTTTTGTKILTLHDLSKTLDKTQHLHPLFSSSSALDRQESLDSHASDQSQSTTQSQCTAINQGSLPHCDWNENDTTTDTTYVSGSDTAGLASSEYSSPITTGGGRSTDDTESPPIRKLRSLCTEALASLPYGEEVLEELAQVAQNIGEMPYPLPELPHIRDIQVSLRSAEPQPSSVIHLAQVPPRPMEVGQKLKSPPPPPVPEPPAKYDSWLGVPTESDPSVLVCLSPSQRGAVKDDSTPDSLLDMHKKFVERRGYHEYTTKQVNAMNRENTSESVKLSNSPPPPPLPPRLQQIPTQQTQSQPHQPSKSNGNETSRNINTDDQNNHRLLAIIRDTHESQQQQQYKSSSENISRRTESGTNTNTTTTTTATNGGGGQEEFANPPSVSKQTQEQRFVSESNKSHSAHHEMQSKQSDVKVERDSLLGIRFPTSDYFDSIFDGTNKRFSNIETASSPGFCSQILSTQPKRYSNIETSSFESRKCVENGKVLYDVSDSSRHTIREGEKDLTSFPEVKPSANGFPTKSPTGATTTATTQVDSRTQTSGDSENIMSAFKLNTQTTAPPPPPPPPPSVSANRTETSPPAPPVPPLPPTVADTNAATTTKSTSTTSSESVINRTFSGETKETVFDDFRQRAKEAAAAGTKNSDAFGHEKLFKDFDELSNLLKDELESGKRRPPATLNDIPSSVRDYNRVAKESKIQNSHMSSTTTTESSRREQMKLLADEIDRTARQRQQQRKEMRIPIHIEKPTPTPPRSAPANVEQPRTYEIPVRVENGNNTRSLHHQRSYEIPIRVEHQSGARPRTYSEHQRSHEAPVQAERPTEQTGRFRRAESMFNVSESSSQRHMLHDDWMKYVGDLGSSENICKPFQREVEICYLGRRPNIRAPRLSASTSDLSSGQSYDTYGAYDVRRTTHNQTPRPQQPPPRRFLSTQSMIDTTPITACVSSGRSPVPDRQRRSSLPREIHDQQMKYISSKENQLQIEFERLENERRQLIDEMNRAQINQRMNREAYRQRQLPPLTEDESFRQQMAEEWLDKVAEREERRLQKIIKISKINADANIPTAPPRRVSSSDIGDEFLRRVKERRSKLHMPSDSDWESGAESQPIPRTDGSRSENEEPPITVLEGHSEASLKQLPKHLREFAKLTSQVKEEHHEETTENSSCSATKKSSVVTTVKTSNAAKNYDNYQTHQEFQQSLSQQDADHRVRDLEQLSQGKRQNLVTILRHKKPAESSSSAGGGSQPLVATGATTAGNSANSAKRRKQTRFLLTPNRRSWSESDLLREIDKDLVLAKGFLYANEFIESSESEMFAPKFKATAPQGSGVWTPKHQTPSSSRTNLNEFQPHNTARSTTTTNSDKITENRSSSACGRKDKGVPTPPPPPLWTPQPERKQFRPVHFESPTLQRRYVRQQSTPSSEAPPPPWSYTNSQPFPGYQSQSCTNLNQKNKAIPWPPTKQVPEATDYQNGGTVIIDEPAIDGQDNDDSFAPTTSIAEKIKSFERSNSNSDLHRPLVRHNPYEKPAILRPNEVIYSVKNEYMSEPETEYDKPKKMAQLSRRQYDGIGPTTQHGMPVVLRSEVKEPNQHEWYKRIFQTIHKQKNPDDYVTIRYKCPRGRYPYKSNGYMSEPEPNYDSDYSTVKYRTLERRRLQSTSTGTGTTSETLKGPSTGAGNDSQVDTVYGTMPNPVKSGQGSYKVQPGRIEDYITGHSSVSEKEKKEWWDEVMDIFNGWLKDNDTMPRVFIEFANEIEQFQFDQQKLSPHYTEGNLSRALLKEQGYTSDSNLVFRKKDVPQHKSLLSPVEQKHFYKSVQAGGQPPLLGFRKPAPEKPKETEFEYLPITPTLTKIRVHSKEVMSKKSQTTHAAQRELICYPITNVSRPIDMFAPFPKHVPSFIPMNQPPLPPNRKSSRTRTTRIALKISPHEMRRPTSANSSRHEACFQRKDALSPPPPRPIKYGTITLKKTVKRTEPLVRSKSVGAVVSLLAACKEEKAKDGRVSRKQQTIRLSSCSPVRSVSRLTALRTSSRSPVAFGRSVSKERSFAEEKKRIEETMPSIRADFTASTNILRDPRLRSPDQVKRAVRSYAYPMERSKSAPRVVSPAKPAMSTYTSTYVERRAPSPTRKVQTSTPMRSSVKTTVVLRSKSHSSKLPEKATSKPMVKASSTVSLARTSSTFSVDSTASKVKPIPKKPLTITRPSARTETEKPKRKPVAISSSKSDSNVLRKIKESSQAKEKIVKAIPSQQKIVRTNHFFENLFMRDSSPKKEAEAKRQPSVNQKARQWNSMSLPLKKLVPELRSSAYRSLSPPARPPYVEEYESIEHFHSEEDVSEFGDRSGRTEDLVWQYEQRSRSQPRAVKSVSDIARPESPAPVFNREFSPTREIRVPQTREMRSPSRRRIQSFRGSQRGETNNVIRASSLSSADDRSKQSLYRCDDISHSANSLEYIERHSPNCRFKNSDRFIDLNRFYSTLERVGQLERATSATSLKPIRKDGEAMDFEEWRKLRFHERAERELNYLVGKLKDDQKQKDFLFRPKDVEDVKWSENKDLSLRSKDKSVEDLRENFEKKIHQEWLDESKRQELESKKDTYKPYWRGSSVADLASSMEIKYNPDSGSFGVQKVKPDEKPLCLSNRLISTLSKDQVSKITRQLNEIYSPSEPKSKPDVTEDYVITVDKHTPANVLKVRCNSSISKEELIGPVLRRKEASVKSPQSKSFDRLSKEVRKFESELTETEKRRLSQTFSREIQGKARSGSPVMLGRETRGAIAAENAKSTMSDIPLPPPLPKDLIDTKKPAPPKPKRKTLEDQKKLDGEALQIETTATETLEKPEDTVSKKIQYFEDRQFEEPAKTIYHAREDSSPDEDEVMRVIEENIKARAQSGKFHHQEMSSSCTDLKDLFGEREASRINFPLPRPPPPPDETVYHETTQNQLRSTSLTMSASRDGSLENLEAIFRSRSISPQNTGTSYLHRVQTGEVRKIKDKFESLGRPKKKKHFFALSPLRKVRSDPELSNDGSKDTFKTVVQENEVGDVSWITHKFETRNYYSRGRSRLRKPGSPIQRNPLRKDDRLMPHIDIISKTASLKQEMMKSRTPSPSASRQQATLHAGEVERIRCLFETSPDRESPHLGTSSPELRDISAHLTASWIAHKYPKPLDNDLRSPPPLLQHVKLEKSVSLPIKEVRRHERIYRSRSISPPKTKPKSAPVTGILKPRYDFFANQKFDPSIHRPKARYVPDSADDARMKTPSSGAKKTSAVKFKDSDEVPPIPPAPPTKGVALNSNGFSNLESPNRYFESDVNIHYKTPIRYEYKDPIPEEELAIRQAESMQKLYQEERRRKYLQELQDMNSRRHTDNFISTQKSPIPLNRYDDFNSDLAPKSPNSSNYPKTIARALYNFQGQTARELTFKKGDVIYIRRQIDKNWYEGEHNAMIGLLPSNYVELITKDGVRQPPKKPSEGQARAKYNFQAQSGIELSINKGELVTLTRRVDDNWFEGKIANRKGIFPVSYVEVLVDIGAEDKVARQQPASQSIITQSSSVRPSLDTLRTNINNEFNSLTSNGQQPPNGILRETRTLHKTEVLHVDTNTEPVAYRALYKYRPQNTDELELQEGDIVYVLEKCDDGWFVGTSQRNGCFGTFPGNYVERV